MKDKNENELIEIESICPKCAGKGIVKNGHITKRGKKCPQCEGEGSVTIFVKKVDK